MMVPFVTKPVLAQYSEHECMLRDEYLAEQELKVLSVQSMD